MPDTFTSPGAAFGQGLEDYMVQQAALKHQALMDQLAVQQAKDTHETAQEVRATRQAESLLKRQKDEEAQADKYAADYMPGDIVSADPDRLRLLKKYHPDLLKTQPAQPAMTAGVPTQFAEPPSPAATPEVPTTPAQPTAIRFTGTPKQREADTQKQQQEAFIQGLPAGDPRRQELQQALEAERLGLKVPPGFFAKPASGDVPTMTREQALAAGHVPKDTKVMEPLPPVDPYKQLLESERLKTMKEKEAADEADHAMWEKLRSNDRMLNGMALDYRRTYHIPTMGMGKDANSIKIAITDRAYDPALRIDAEGHGIYTDPKTGVTTPVSIDIAAYAAAYKANSQALSAQTKNLAAVSTFLDTADRNSKILEDTLKKLPNTDSTDVNTLLRSAATRLGSQEVAAFNTMLPSVQAEYARVIQQPNLTGVLSDTARKEVGSTLPANATVGQIRTALKLLKQEGANRKAATKDQIDLLNREIGLVGAEKSHTPTTSKTAKELYDQYK
jgi:hypothetical protein